MITPRIPFPPFRGDNLHAFNIARTLAQSNELDLVTLIANDKQIKFVDELKKEKIRTHVVNNPIFISVLKLIPAFFQNIPFQVTFFSSRKLAKLISDLTNKNKYDLIYFHLIRSIQYFPSTKNSSAIKVVDFTDAVSLYLSRYLKFLKNPFRKLFFNSELKRIEKYEVNAKVFDSVFLCSEIDKNHLEKKLEGLIIQILRNGVNEKFFNPPVVPFEKYRIMFSGNMPYYPNKDAALFFAKNIFPAVSIKYPDSKFYIVGQKPSRTILKLSSEKIIVTGFVEDIRNEYLKSEINVAPIRFGAGTPNKVIESLALGIPVVASETAIGGLPNELRKYIFIANTADEFIEKISYIFENETVRTDLMKECSELVPKILGWDVIIKNFESYIKSKLETK